ncbi:unnamed protein product, partial [Heterotrigona itama]
KTKCLEISKESVDKLNLPENYYFQQDSEKNAKHSAKIVKLSHPNLNSMKHL